MFSKIANKALAIHLNLINACSRDDQQEEDYIRIGFIVTCMYMWIIQTIYCGLIELFAISAFCLSSFILQATILVLYKRNLLNTNWTYNLIILITIIELQLSYINAGAGVNPTIIWLTAIPIISVTLLGIKQGGLWSLLSAMFSIIAMEVIARHDIQPSDWSDWHYFNVGQSNLFTGPLLFFMMFGFYSFNRKKLQSKITAQAIELEQEKSEKGKLLTVLFHDLGRNTSLLSGYLELSGQKTLDQNSRNKIFQLSEEIKSILKNAKDLDSQKAILKAENINIAESFNLLKNKFESKLNEKHLSFIFKSSNNISLIANLSQFNNQILGNLLSNAIKFSEPSTEILFKALKKDNNIMLFIENYGIGYTDESIRMGTAGEKGSGQGLKIVREFSNMNNITFSIYQEGGKTVCHLIAEEAPPL